MPNHHKRKRRKPGCVLLLYQLRELMPDDKAWTVDKIARETGKQIPNARRYLRMLVNLRLMVFEKFGRKKYYMLVENLIIWKRRIAKNRIAHHADGNKDSI